MTGLYSILHFLVDGVCAWAMLGRLSGDYGGILLYNFCAFALQLPLGAVLDRLEGRRMPLLFASVGCGLTLVGAFAGPAVLGIGNALFHVGGGVDVIREDAEKGLGGQALGIFVAPGALGLYLGGLIGQCSPLLLIPAGLVMALLLRPVRGTGCTLPEPTGKHPLWLFICCFAVVVLRSHVGMAVTFPWKTGFLALLAVMAVVLGKMAGGVLAARFGAKLVTIVSLSVAAIGFLFGDAPLFGLLALLCFNMTMPLTLYALWRRFPAYPGACFGSLTLALFLGFLPTYFGLELPLGGTLGSVLSLILLWKAVDDDASDLRPVAGADAAP